MQTKQEDNKEILLRLRTIAFVSMCGEKRTKEQYAECITKKDSSISCVTNTLLIYTRPDRPGKVFFRKYYYNSRPSVTQKGKFFFSKIRQIETVIFDTLRKNFMTGVYHHQGKVRRNVMRINTDLSESNLINIGLKSMAERLNIDYEHIFDVLCGKLGFSFENVKRLATLLDVDNLAATMTYFLFHSRGLDMNSMLAGPIPTNISRYINTLAKYVAPGNTITGVVMRMFNVDYDNADLLLTDHKFSVVFHKQSMDAFKVILNAMKITPGEVLISKWSESGSYKYRPKMFKILGDNGFGFYDLKDLDLTEVLELANVINYFDLLGLSVRKEKLLQITRTKADFDALRMMINEFLSENCSFIPKNNRVVKKLNNDVVRFDPVYYYTRCLKYGGINDFPAAYQIRHKTEGCIGLLLLSRLDETSKVIFLNNGASKFFKVSEHITHKSENTKLVNYLDYKIKYHKHLLKEFLDEKLTDQYKDLLIWN